MKVLVLFDVDRRIDPEENFTLKELRKEEKKPTEADVISCLRGLGHEVEQLAVYDNVREMIDGITGYAPDIVFNLCETFFLDRAHEPNIPALLDLMKVRYTGAGPEALLLCKDKALAKKLLTFHRVKTAGFLVSRRAHPLKRLKGFRFPAFVKPVSEEGSNGISKASFAKNEEEAIERATFVHEKIQSDALIEEYIEGREITVGVLGNPRVITLPPREIFYGKAEDDEKAPHFTTWAAKFDDAYRKKWGIKNGKADPIPEKTLEKLNRTARLAHRLFKIERGIVRLDCRIDANGEVYVIEVNPNPSLARGDDFAQSAKEAGIEYEQLVQKILDNALREKT